jgi:hypothetical protein
MGKYKSYCEMPLTNVFYCIINYKHHDVPVIQKTVTEITESSLAFTEYYSEKGITIQML